MTVGTGGTLRSSDARLKAGPSNRKGSNWIVCGPSGSAQTFLSVGGTEGEGRDVSPANFTKLRAGGRFHSGWPASCYRLDRLHVFGERP